MQPDHLHVAAPSVGTCVQAIVGTAAGAIRPPRPDRRFVDALSLAPLPAVRQTVQVTVLRQRPRLVPSAFVAEGTSPFTRLEIGLTTMVVTHPRARFLLDPAVSRAVHERVIPEHPRLIRAAVRPPRDIVATAEALDESGLTASSLDFALVTHAHWDHVCGLLDFPDLPVALSRTDHAWVTEGDVAPVGGVRSALADRETRLLDLDGPRALTFGASHDLFGDGSVVLVDLSGHTPGSLGVVLATEQGRVLITGDAAWHSRQVDLMRSKAAFPGLLVDHDPDEAFRVLQRLHVAATEVRVVPTHDHAATAELARRRPRWGPPTPETGAPASSTC